MTAPDSCGCVACEFLARDPHYPWPPEHVWVALPDGAVMFGTYWPKLARVSWRTDGVTHHTTAWRSVSHDTVEVLTLPRSRAPRSAE